MDDEGALMLMNILKSTPDWERLEQAGISPIGIDFVKRTLVIEPAERAQETEQLRHPWLIGYNVEPAEVDARVGGDGVDELDASQLSLGEFEGPNDFGATVDDVDETQDPRETKRSKYHDFAEPDPPVNIFGNSDQHAGWNGVSAHQWNGSQSLNHVSQQGLHSIHQPQANRLFGEIGSSALRSSGVLGGNLHAALGVTEAGSYDPTSNESSYMHPDMASAEDVSYLNSNIEDEHMGNTDLSSAQHPLHYPQILPGHPYAGPAPSLFGTEALVGQLNMASPESGASGPSVDSKPATPRTPASRELSPDPDRDSLPHGTSKSPGTQITPRQATAGRMQYEEASAHRSAHLKEGSNSIGGSTRTHELSALGAELRSQDIASSSDTHFHNDGQQIYGTSKSDISLLPTAYNSQGSIQDEQQDHVITGSSPKAHDHAKSHIKPAPPVTLEPPSLIVPTREPRPNHSFVKPPFRFGNLTPTAGSIHSVPIKISAQATTYGRDLRSDFIHPNPKEDRIPKHAIDIAMWYPGIEQDFASGKTDWHLNENLTAIISTGTSRYIKINDIRLMQGDDCWLYGKLKTGDIITVFAPIEGVEMSRIDSKHRQYLRYRCEFFVGKSKEPRRPDEPFVVYKEVEQFRENEMRNSRESSAVKSRDGSQVAVAAVI